MEKILKSLANDVRIKILRLISDEEKNVGQITDILGMTQAAVSQHLKALRDAKLVNVRREKSNVLYSTAYPEETKSIFDLVSKIKNNIDF